MRPNVFQALKKTKPEISLQKANHQSNQVLYPPTGLRETIKGWNPHIYMYIYI